ncbi:unnamed protein product [Prunus armeniaca]|uniref:Uncharacterized protein n=1 Tax=Prunus armeniaca TaxID=36596 RepID=A0A6J5TF27_PRUAR|nr:unnamed protein product [Prunus armeniaca]CAB4292332.1 unnamed protein product [Prunus armeniaca]
MQKIVMKFKSNTLNLKRLSEVAFNINTVPTRKETQTLKSPVSKLTVLLRASSFKQEQSVFYDGHYGLVSCRCRITYHGMDVCSSG